MIAKEAMAAGYGERHYNPVAFFELGNAFANVFYNTHEFMSQYLIL